MAKWESECAVCGELIEARGQWEFYDKMRHHLMEKHPKMADIYFALTKFQRKLEGLTHEFNCLTKVVFTESLYQEGGES